MICAVFPSRAQVPGADAEARSAPEPPPDLRAALEQREATVTRVELDPPKVYLHADGADGPLFAWYSTNPTVGEAIAHEAAAREAVGTNGVLRAPPLLARGSSWRLERRLTGRPLGGSSSIETVVAAAQELAELDLPESTAGSDYHARGVVMRQRLRLATSPLPLHDFLRARRLLRRSRLPRVTSHGDFHLGHLFLEQDALWVIDWALAGLRPQGYDLMLLWADLESNDDREFLFEATLRMLGTRARRDLLELRYAMLVHLLASLFADISPAGRDPARGRRLLRLLEEVRPQQ